MESLYLKGDIKGAIKIGNKYKKMAEESGDVDSRSYAKLLQVLGVYNIEIGNFKAGENQLESALKIEEKFGAQPEEIAVLQNYIGGAFLSMKKFIEAEKWIKLSGLNFKLSKKTTTQNFVEYIENIGLLEQAYYHNKDKAFMVFEKALGIIQNLRKTEKGVKIELRKASLLYNIAYLKMLSGNNKEALEILHKVVFLYEKAKRMHQSNMAYVYCLLGRIYTRMGKYNIAMDYYRKALNIANKSMANNHYLIGELYAEIGVIYGSKGDYGVAENYFCKSISFNRKFYGKNTLRNIVVLGSLAYLYYQEEDYLKGLKKCDLALSLYRKNKYAPDVSFLDILDTKLRILQKIGKKEEALKCRSLIKNYSSKIYK